MREAEMDQIAEWISEVLTHLNDAATEQRVRKEVLALTGRFPLYPRRLAQAETALQVHAGDSKP
jgi:glycine hydroxymethyltransferase